MSSRGTQLVGSLVAAVVIVVLTLLFVGALLPSVADRLPEEAELRDDEVEREEERQDHRAEEREEERDERDEE